MKFVLIIVASLLLTACGDKPSSSSPEKSVETLFMLMNKGEVEKANAFFSKEWQDKNAAEGLTRIFAGKIKEFTVKKADVMGDVATVYIHVNNDPKDGVINLIRKNGVWVVNGVSE